MSKTTIIFFLGLIMVVHLAAIQSDNFLLHSKIALIEAKASLKSERDDTRYRQTKDNVYFVARELAHNSNATRNNSYTLKRHEKRLQELEAMQEVLIDKVIK